MKHSSEGWGQAWEMDAEEVTLSGISLGGGNTSTVALGLWQHVDVAVRQFEWSGTAQQADLFCRAMCQASSLRHPHLVLLLGAVVEGPEAPLVVQELCEVDVAQHIKQGIRNQVSYSVLLTHAHTRLTLPVNPDATTDATHFVTPQAPMDAAEVARHAIDMMLAVRYLHDKGLVHGAITSRKLLIDKEGRAKLLYLPREALREAPEYCGHEEDIFDCGAVIVEMARGSPVTSSDNYHIKQGLADVPWPRIRDVCAKCLEQDPEARPTARATVDMLRMCT